MVTSLPGTILNVGATVAVPRSASICLAASGDAGPIVLCQNGAMNCRYSKTPEFANGNVIPVCSF